MSTNSQAHKQTASRDVPVPAPATITNTQTIWHITFGTYGARLHGGSTKAVNNERYLRNVYRYVFKQRTRRG